jgi:hypothetical protein
MTLTLALTVPVPRSLVFRGLLHERLHNKVLGRKDCIQIASSRES